MKCPVIKRRRKNDGRSLMLVGADWWEPVDLDIRIVCSTEKSSEILSSCLEKKEHNYSKAIL